MLVWTKLFKMGALEFVTRVPPAVRRISLSVMRTMRGLSLSSGDKIKRGSFQ